MIDALKEYVQSGAEPEKIIEKIKRQIKDYVDGRLNDDKQLKREIYKWDIVCKWYGRDVKTKTDLTEWVKGDYYDPSSKNKKGINNLISRTAYSDWQDGIIAGERGNDAELSSAMALIRSDNFDEIVKLPINNWTNKNGQHKKIDLQIVSTYLMCHNPFDYMQVKKAEFEAARSDWKLKIGFKEYEQWLRTRKVSKNSSSFYMRTLRSAYNKVISRNQMEQTFPFRNVYTGVERTRKRAVPEDIMVRLQKLDLTHSAPLAFSRDMFIFSYCTRGMAFVDIAYLKKEDVSGGILSYVRHKTGQRLTVRIEPLIEEIIERYEPFVHNSPYLFPIITSNDPEEAFRQYQTALGYHNRKLKKLGKLTGENLHLSSYTARHSWATVARKHNVPLSVISAGMGHTSEKTTLIYLDSVENSLIDKANEEILEALCRNVSK